MFFRLFDSQNNARGGYNSGPGMSYFVGSILQLEYTSQHTCGERNSNCELVLQYMCHDKIRDGGEEKYTFFLFFLVISMRKI